MIVYALAFTKEFNKDQDSSLKPLKSITDLIPKITDTHLDKDRWSLSASFLLQGFFKQLLTEGEKYLFTWFSLMTLAQQGVYDAVANLGSLAARLIFSKVEEASYLYFNQSVNRDAKNDVVNPNVSKHLSMILRAMTLLGLLVFAFGFSYSHLLLHLYGGTNLSSGLGPSLLRGQCFFVLFMAVNGVSECYSFAIMTSKEVNDYNYLMSGMTVIFLSCAWVLSNIFGPLGFIMANCCNFIMRICHSCFVIQKQHSGAANEKHNPLKGFVPPWQSLVALVISGMICQASEQFIYVPGDWKSSLSHVVIGAICFCVTILIMLVNESQIVTFARKKLKRE